MPKNIKELVESAMENLKVVSQEALDAAIELEVYSFLLKEFDLKEAIDLTNLRKAKKSVKVLWNTLKN